jgi:hypothetical protein
MLWGMRPSTPGSEKQYSLLDSGGSWRSVFWNTLVACTSATALAEGWTLHRTFFDASGARSSAVNCSAAIVPSVDVASSVRPSGAQARSTTPCGGLAAFT